MIIIHQEKCKSCGICVKNCPLDVLKITEHKASIVGACVECGVCLRVCPFGAIERPQSAATGDAICDHCPVQCHVPEGGTGACKRYVNRGGELVRARALVLENSRAVYPDAALTTPVITGTGAGTAYPCCRPAPYIARENRDGVDVVTVVTEAPLSYSGVTVKIDTNAHIGETGQIVYRGGKPVGLVATEEYGSKMLQIGGANLLTGRDGFLVARTIVELANGEPVTLTVDKKIRLEVQAGQPPVINGDTQRKMRVGCGSATVGLFAPKMKEAAEEVIVIDHHVIGLLTEHLAGAEVGLSWSGVLVNANKSSRGRYFGDLGDGIGGTTIGAPRDIIRGADMTVAKAGLRIFVTDTTGGVRALFRLEADGSVTEIPLTEAVTALADEIRTNCEDSRVSVIYTGGSGGSARGGVCEKPLQLTQAVHAGKAVLTIGGAPAFVLPGGGINFMVDAGQVADHSFTWVPTPATVAPVEYTMTAADYEAIGGHLERVVDRDSL